MEPAEKVSVEHSLELDLADEGKLEFLNGAVFAMAGAPRHNQIVANIFEKLLVGLASGPCRVWSQDQRGVVQETQSYVYPDIVVICDEPSFDTAARPASLRNPSVIVEVLSESTLDYDLGAKLGHYRRLPSVKQILFVHVDTRATTLVTRQSDGSWNLVDQGPSGSVELAGVTVTLDTIYARTASLPV